MNDRPVVMSPVMPSGVTATVVGSIAPVAGSVPFWVRSAIGTSLVKFGLEAVHRPIVLMVTLGIMTPAMAPVKFLMNRFIPFLKLAAAILMTLADSLALGPRISAHGQNKTY
jgi:hypothetical protein